MWDISTVVDQLGWVQVRGYLKASCIFCYKRHLTNASFLLKVAEGGTIRDGILLQSARAAGVCSQHVDIA